MNERLLTVRQAAEFLGISPSTLYDKVAEGRVPYVRLWEGRRKTALRFTESSLWDHVKRNTVRPVSASK